MRAARLAGLVALQRPRALRSSLLAAQFARQATRPLSLDATRPVTRNRWWAALNRTGINLHDGIGNAK